MSGCSGEFRWNGLNICQQNLQDNDYNVGFCLLRRKKEAEDRLFLRCICQEECSGAPAEGEGFSAMRDGDPAVAGFAGSDLQFAVGRDFYGAHGRIRVFVQGEVGDRFSGIQNGDIGSFISAKAAAGRNNVTFDHQFKLNVAVSDSVQLFIQESRTFFGDHPVVAQHEGQGSCGVFGIAPYIGFISDGVDIVHAILEADSCSEGDCDAAVRQPELNVIAADLVTGAVAADDEGVVQCMKVEQHAFASRAAFVINQHEQRDLVLNELTCGVDVIVEMLFAISAAGDSIFQRSGFAGVSTVQHGISSAETLHPSAGGF